MKKLFLSLIAVVAGAMSCYAQDDLVATLSHGSNLTTYIGADALSEAYSAAVTGDIITLSSGTFNGVNIEKAITIRGAGMMAMESNGNVPTQISGDVTFNVPSGSSPITLEGVQMLGAVNLKGEKLAPVNLLKSRFESWFTGYGVLMNAHSCIFACSLTAAHNYPYNTNTTMNCLNCVIVNAHSEGYHTSVVAKIVATNCDVYLEGSDNTPYSNYTNCIITGYIGNPHNLAESCSANYCVGTGNVFEKIVDLSNTTVEDYSSIYKTYKGGTPSATEGFELTSTAATTYLGDDGKQVGIYGGTNPFDPTPTNPQVKKFTIDSTTSDGKLKVTINVE